MKKLHKWKLKRVDNLSGTRVYQCVDCEIAIPLKEFEGKGQLAKKLKQWGSDPNCNNEQVKRIMDS